jgi:hypothetical protein
MKRFSLIILALVIACASPALAQSPEIPDSIDAIEVSLDTPSKINNALHVIKMNHPEDYRELKALEKSDPEAFQDKLRRLYYTWLHTEVLKKKRRVREKGYRQKVHDSEILFRELRKKYRKASAEEKPALREEIRRAALERHAIELEFLEYKTEQAREFLEEMRTRTGRFDQNKDAYVSRLVTKCTRERTAS